MLTQLIQFDVSCAGSDSFAHKLDRRPSRVGGLFFALPACRPRDVWHKNLLETRRHAFSLAGQAEQLLGRYRLLREPRRSTNTVTDISLASRDGKLSNYEVGCPLASYLLSSELSADSGTTDSRKSLACQERTYLDCVAIGGERKWQRIPGVRTDTRKTLTVLEGP